MKYCPNCGKAIEEGTEFCSGCGTNVSGKQTVSAAGSRSNFVGKVQKRDLAICIILSIVTCGIYGIIWFVNMVNDVNTLSEDPDAKSGGVVFLLTIVTCGIYGIIWYYQAGQKMYEAGKKAGLNIADNSTIYLICEIVCSIVPPIMLQLDLNKFAE